MSRGPLIAIAAAVLFAGGAGGTVAYLHSIDPLRRADRLTEQGDIRGAQVELRNAIRKDPGAAEPHLRMARLQLKLADPVAAEREFRLAVARGGNRAEIIPELGEAMLAQSEFTEVLQVVPARGPTPELTARNLLLRAVAQIGVKDIRAAENTLADAQKTVPDTVQTALIAARLAALRDDAAGAEAQADLVLKRDPAQIDALLMKESLLAARGDSAGAMEMAERAVKSSPYSAMARTTYAGLLMDAKQDDKAQAEVDQVLSNQPRFMDALYLHALLLARRGALEDAANELTALELSVQRMPQILFAQANVAARLGRTQTAAEAARRYHALVPGDYAGTLLLARAALAVNRGEEARTLLLAAVNTGHTDAETLDLLGRAFAATGDARNATAAFAQAASAAPSDPAVASHLGFAQMLGGDAKEAAATLTRALETGAEVKNAGEALVAAFLELNQPDKAQEALNKLSPKTTAPDTLAVLGAVIKVRRGDIAGAEAALTDALKQFPTSANVKLNLARVYAVEGRRNAAITLLSDVLAKDPANLPVLAVYLTLLRQAGTLPPAIQALDAARKLRPDLPVLAANLADALTAVGTPDKAITMLTQASGNAPLTVPTLAALARAQAAAGRLSEAEESWRAVLKLAPADRYAASNLLDLLLRRGDADGARDLLQAMHAGAPGDLRIMATMVALEERRAGPEAAMRLAGVLRAEPDTLPASALLKGDLMMRENRAAEAVRAYQADQANGPPGTTQMRLAVAQVRAGLIPDATETLTALLARFPANPDAAQALAQLDIMAGRLADAEAHLQTVLAQRPDDPVALNNLAWIYAERKDPRARAIAQRAYLNAPTPNAADTLGWIMVRDGDAKSALPLLQQSSDRQPDEPTFKYHLAVALRDTGQADEAVRVLQPIVQGPAAFTEKDAARHLLETLPRGR